MSANAFKSISTPNVGSRLSRDLRSGLTAIALAIALFGCDAVTESPAVETAGTRYLGVQQDSEVRAFLGIPFAKPPVDDLRWERPVPANHPLGDVDATKFRPACMQTGSGLAWYHGMMSRVGVDPSLMDGPEYSEDCLYLNVWTDGKVSDPKPVLVFIHGGSNTGGWSYEPNYHGNALAARGVVVVTVAYRLGVFGWLSHPDMSIQNPGLHDLTVALAWVKENIAAFGGDPSRVVVSGESAGADNALHLAVAPAMRGRLAGVIHQSAGWSAARTLSTEEGFALGTALVERHLGAKGDFDALKQIPAAELLDSQLELFSEHYFSPIQDPETLPTPLEEMVAGNSFPSLNIILGSNGNESLMYIPEGSRLENYLEEFFPRESWDDIKLMLGANLSELEQMDRLRSAVQYTCPSLAIAAAAGKAGGSAYVYRFDRVREGFAAIGAYHGAELPYVFDTHDMWLPTDAIDRRITNMLVDYWLAFLGTGHPSDVLSTHSKTTTETKAINRIPWPEWSSSQQSLVVSDEPYVGSHPEAALCEFLNATKATIARH